MKFIRLTAIAAAVAALQSQLLKAAECRNTSNQRLLCRLNKKYERERVYVEQQSSAAIVLSVLLCLNISVGGFCVDPSGLLPG